MVKTVADQFAEILAAVGVKRIYGIVGDSLNGLTDALRRQGKIEWIHVRHEEVAAFAAGAEAHFRRADLAVCAGSCGTWQTCNLINGLFDCHRSAGPVLAIASRRSCAGQKSACAGYAGNPSGVVVSGLQPLPRSDLRRQSNAPAYAGDRDLATPSVKRGAAYPSSFLRITRRRSPAARRERAGGAQGIRLPVAATTAVVTPRSSELERLAALLNRRARVTMLCGSGCAGAHAQLLQLWATPLAESAFIIGMPLRRCKGARRPGQSLRCRHDWG